MKFSVEKITSELDMQAREISLQNPNAANRDALSSIRCIKYALHSFKSISKDLMDVIDQTLISAGVWIELEACHEDNH